MAGLHEAFIRIGHDPGDPMMTAHCFSGDTRYLTRDGVRTLAETVGTVQWVLTGSEPAHGGYWAQAIIHEFGVQPLLSVTLKRNKRTKVIRATPHHDWIVTAGPARAFHRRVKTSALRPGHRLAHLRHPRFERGYDHDGVRMGFVFGDGSIYRTPQTTHGAVTLWGAKRDLCKFFDEVVSTQGHDTITPNGVPGVRYTSGLAGFTKELPALTAPPEYLLGWLMGYFAADGEVSANGQCNLSGASLDTLMHVRDVATLLGIGTYAPSSKSRRGFGTEDSLIHTLGFSASDLGSAFFLRDDQRLTQKAVHHERFGWTVVSVEDLGEKETVYCPRVPGTESFVLEDNIHSGQCPFCGSGQVIGQSDGNISCDFCGTVYIVRVQPAFSGMPQSPMGPGAPTDIGPDGMPMGPEMGPDGMPMDPSMMGEDGEMPPGGDEEGGDDLPPFMDDGGGDEEDGAGPPGGGEDGPPEDAPPPPPKSKKKSSRTFRTLAGDELPEGAYIRHLALLHSGMSTPVLARLRAEAAAGPARQEYTKHYNRGWGSSERATRSTGYGDSPLERADDRKEPEAWYDGYLDHAGDRPKYHTRDCPSQDHGRGADCTLVQDMMKSGHPLPVTHYEPPPLREPARPAAPAPAPQGGDVRSHLMSHHGWDPDEVAAADSDYDPAQALRIAHEEEHDDSQMSVPHARGDIRHTAARRRQGPSYVGSSGATSNGNQAFVRSSR